MKMHIESNQPVNIDIHRINYHDRHDHHHRHGHHDHIVIEPPLPPVPPPPAHEPPNPHHHNHDEPNGHNCFMKILELIGEAAHAVLNGFFHI